MDRAEKLVRKALQRAPIRNVILSVAAVVLLLIAGVQSRLLVISPKLGMNTLNVASNIPPGPSVESLRPDSRAAQNADVPSAGTTAVSRSSLAAPKSKRRKTLHPVSRQPASAAGARVPEVVVPLSSLDVAVRHQCQDATLFVWVDGQLALTRPVHGGLQKRMVVFNGVRGVDSETLRIPAGTHTLRVRALSSDQTTDLSKTVTAEFIGGAERSLQVTFDKHNTAIHLSWQ